MNSKKINLHKNRFDRMRKTKVGVIFNLALILCIGIPLIIYSLVISLFAEAFFICFLVFILYLILKMYFFKDVFSYIIIYNDRIEWVNKDSTIYVFPWMEIEGVRLGSYAMTRTFDLILSEKMTIDLRRTVFSFECNEEIRTYIVENTDVSWVVDRFMNFDI